MGRKGRLEGGDGWRETEVQSQNERWIYFLLISGQKKKRSPSYLLALTKDCEPRSGDYSAVHKKSPKQSFRPTHMRMSTRLDRKAPAMSEVTIITLSLATKKKKKKKQKVRTQMQVTHRRQDWGNKRRALFNKS